MSRRCEARAGDCASVLDLHSVLADRRPPPERRRRDLWDRGTYEQGGRVAWPEALERGHAVFVLHGEKLRGGFALQRTRPGAKPQWLLIKRRDDEARPGSDLVTERPESVISGRTLAELRGPAACSGG